jgi:hypothetical protein
MVGSIPALIAHAAFVGLLAYGWAVGELKLRQVAVSVALWLLGRIGLPYVPYEPARNMFSSFVAALDIALVFLIFKGDVRLSR